jgi:23S rRNA pseudouridine2605 synthase
MTRRPPPSPAPSTEDAAPRGERLQKVLAAAGIGSRRECEELILAGRVEVDRQTITELGTRVDPLEQEIRVDGTPLTQPKRVYYAVHKPPGVVSTSWDPDRRVRVIDLVKTDERLFAVGRLDRTSEGLILVTNDGALANRLTHPRYGVEKTYLARIAGSPSPESLERLRSGVHLAEGVARVASVQVKRRHRETTELEIVLNEGRNREIRRLLARIGHKVLQLKRIAVGPLRLGSLPIGSSRPLTRDEVALLQRATTGPPRTEGVQTSRPGVKPGRAPRPAGGGHKAARGHGAAAKPSARKPGSAKAPRPAVGGHKAAGGHKTASKREAVKKTSPGRGKAGGKPKRKIVE